MTAIKTITLESGITVENAIHRVESISVGYKNTMTYTVRQYVSLDKPFFGEFKITASYSGGDIHSECYADLMLSGEYSEA